MNALGITRQQSVIALPMLIGFGALLGAGSFGLTAQGRLSPQSGPLNSSSIAITADDRYLWSVNPDNNTVSVFNVASDANVKLTEVPVGREPWNVALDPRGQFVWVSNTVDGTLSVIDASNPSSPTVIRTLEVGTEPYGMVFAPNGTRLYVANARSNDVVVVDPIARRVIRRINGVGLEPRGMAITNDGDASDTDETLYVTQFFAVDRPGVIVGADDYKEGRVTVISTATDQVVTTISLPPMSFTGFSSNGSALNRIPGTSPPAFFHPTAGFPNQMPSIVIKGNRAYLPNTAASPDGPVRFNVNIQAFLNVIDLTTNQEGKVGSTPQAINMNRGVQFEPSGRRVFFASPWAIAFERSAPEGYAVAAASNLLVKVLLDPNGTPTINAPTAPSTSSPVIRIPVGQNPRGITINSTDTRAYVMNYVSRDISVVDLATDTVQGTMVSSALPTIGTLASRVQIGKAIFNSSTGVNLSAYGTSGVIPPVLSSEGWGSCFSCHPFGLTDGVTWIFAAGPRRTVPMNTTFNPRNPSDQKILNHSAIFDEVQDFELNIRNVSGGFGLITLPTGSPDPNVSAFFPPNAGRSAGLDALNDYVKTIRTPIAPRSSSIPQFLQQQSDISIGRSLFERGRCVNCHGGGGWSRARLDFTPPPNTADVVNTQLKRFLRDVGTFNPAAFNEIRANGTPPLGADGYVPASLLGAHGLGPYLHNGSAATLDDVLLNVKHRSAGTVGIDTLTSPSDRQKLVAFLKSIDASTTPFP